MSKGTVPITGTITTTNDLDTYPTHWDKFAKGGLRTVISLAQRDAITTERRSEGMQVYVRDVRQLQQLIGGIDNTKWVTLLTIDVDNRVIVNNDLNLQKYIIEGTATPLLPNAVPLASQADGYLVNTAGIVSTTTSFSPSDIALSSGKLLIGDSSNKAIETQTVNINNLPTGDLTGGGMIKYDSTSNLLKIATPDTDYATVVTLNAIAAEAQKSATAASADAGAASASATVASAAASTATTMAGVASTYADAASASSTGAAASAVLALASADAAAAETLECSKQVSLAKAAATVSISASDYAASSASGAAVSAGKAQSSLDTLLATGLNSLPNSGDIDIKGYKIINAADGVNPTDLATVEQLGTIGSTYVKSVSGTTGNISSTGGQTPVLDLVNTAVTPGSYLLSNITFDAKGRGTAASSTTLTGVSNRIAVSGYGTGSIVIDLVNTVVTPGNYFMMNASVDAAGRIVTAASTVLLGASGRTAITGLGTNNVTIDLVKTAVVAGSYISPNVTFDDYGRATASESVNISGVANRIFVGGVGTSSITIDLVNTLVTPGTYHLSNPTIDASGRITTATSTTISGTASRISVTGSGTTTMAIDLINTAVTPGTYNLSNPTIDASGRVTAATSTTISGTTGRVVVSGAGTSSMSIDLGVATSAVTNTIGQHLGWDTYGRIISYEAAAYCICTTGGQSANTTVPTTGALYTANLPLGTVKKSVGFGSWTGGTAGVPVNTTFSADKTVTVNLTLSRSGTYVADTTYIVLVKNVLTTPVYYGFADIAIDYKTPVTITSLIPLQGGDLLYIQFQESVAGKVITTHTCNWTIA
jgi:hypothetical protein